MSELRKRLQSTLCFTLGLLSIGYTCLGQTLIVDDSAFTPQHLVENILATYLVEVSNVQFTGDAAQIGLFNGTQSNIGLDGGIILSSGRVVDAMGPNGTPISDYGTEFSNPGDSSLNESIAIGHTYDAAILEFDFSTPGDSIYLRYVFASNEYMFYAGANITDAFAFFISGPGITGEQNIARIPGTITPVSIDNVNANVNSHLYIDNENPPGLTVEYNGFTVPFVAAIPVVSGGIYHIRLVVADGADELYDSAVLLQAFSLTSSAVGLGISDGNRIDHELTLYPNPTNSTIRLESKRTLRQVWLTDIAGKRLMLLQQNNDLWQADLSSLPAGVYLIKAEAEDNSYTVKKVVKN